MQNLVICAKDWPHVRKCVQVSEKERTMWSTSGTEDTEAHVVKWRRHANSVEISVHSKLPSMRLFAELSAIGQGRWRAPFQQTTSNCTNALHTPLETIIVPQHPQYRSRTKFWSHSTHLQFHSRDGSPTEDT